METCFEIDAKKPFNYNIWAEIKAAGVSTEGLCIAVSSGVVYSYTQFSDEDIAKIQEVVNAHDYNGRDYWEQEYLTLIRASAYTYITKAYPEWKQANILRDYVYPHNTNPNIVPAFEAMSQHIDEARYISNQFEQRIKTAATKDEMDSIMVEAQELYGSEV